ncbi:MAG: c-type cytochrome [Planctomycetia bacterium]|nr:c-type cytochrome [Planctomycetia bacterium]
MRPTVAFLIAVLLVAASPLAAQDPFASQVAPTDPLSPQEQQKRFQVPPGFEVQLVAAEPDVRKPINLAFDAAGRLYATQSVEYPFPAADAAQAKDYLSIYEDFAPDGRAQKITKVLDGLNIPMGVAPTPQGLLIYSIPNVYLCRDENRDGTFDKRDVALGPFGHRDTHGMVNNLSPWVDGWVYGCHGFANESQPKGTDGRSITMNSGNTFRVRPDGAGLEYFTHGQVNPFGLTFDRLGNLFSTDCHTLPGYQLLRGAYYPSFGKPHDGLGYGPEMMSHNHGSTGLAGIAYYAADYFPPEYRDTLFIGNPITRRINHDRLERKGSTFKAIEQPDFLFCNDPWFRPVDVELGPDGALYIADFYNRIIGHYEVPLTHPLRDRERGRIWRVVYKGKPGGATVEAPKLPGDLTKATVDELVALLGHANLKVQAAAVEQLVARGTDAAPVVRKVLGGKSSPEQRAFGLWVLERLGQLDRSLVERLAGDDAPLVRVHLVKALAERPDWTGERAWAGQIVVDRIFKDGDPFVVRAAAEALGRHPKLDNVPFLVETWKNADPADAVLIHTVRIALREHLLVPELATVVKGYIGEHELIAARLAEASLGAPTPDAAEYLFAYLQRYPEQRERLGPYVHHAARHLPEARLTDFYKALEAFREAPADVQRTVLRNLNRASQERARPLPQEVVDWACEVADGSLASKSEPEVKGGIELAAEMHMEDVFSQVAAVARRESAFAGLRAPAIDALAAVHPQKALAVLSAIAADAADSLEARRRAAFALAAVNNDAGRAELVKLLPHAPQPVAVEISVGLSRSRPGCEELLKLVEEGKASARLLQEHDVERGLRAADLPKLDERLQKLLAGVPPLDVRIAQLIEARKQGFAQGQGDAAQGLAVFKKSCAACHKLGGEGTKIGPELDGIGHRGLDRVLEDLLDPSRTVDQAFRAIVINTKDGRVVQGLKLREEGEVLVVADKDGKEVRVPSGEIEAQELTRLSPMPANVSELMPPAEFNHLLAFLLSQRQKPAAAGGP